MVTLVRAYLDAKETDKAVSFLNDILKSDSDNAEAYVLLGSVALADGVPDQAMKDFVKATEKQPKNGVGYRAIADLDLREKNTGAALAALRAGLQQQPNSITLHMALASVLERVGQYEASIAEYENVLTLQPGSMIAANNLASLLVDHRTDKASLERAQSVAAILQQSQVPQFKDTLGWVSYRTGDFETAVSLLEQAVTELPDQALVHYHLAMSYAATHQAAKASIEFKAALARNPNNNLKETIEAEMIKLAAR